MLRAAEFPGGLQPVADALQKIGTTLGIWFGPTGGYSYRLAARLDGAHGYEVTADQLCVGGTNYHALLKQRVTDFTAKHGVGYFKWDGIQFACSEPDHGHPVGIYSRRAVLDSVIDLAGLCAPATPTPTSTSPPAPGSAPGG